MSDNVSSKVKYTHIRVIVIASTQQQRNAFSDTVQSLGMCLVDCIASNAILDKHLLYNADVWLIDSGYDETIYDKLNGISTENNRHVLLGFEKAPFLNESQLYARWQRKIKRKLADLLEIPELISTDTHLGANKFRAWEYVVFLGASMGGPTAVKSFLDALPAHLPITIILAHHFNHKMIHTLPRILNRHNDWKCQVITTSQILQAGSCLIVPIEQKVVFDSTGRVILKEDLWQDEYKPCIGDLLKNSSDVYGEELIGIIFSGMGIDGCQNIDLIKDNNSKIWAQDPSSSACPSQPQSIIDTGICQFVGTPEALAGQINRLLASEI